MPTNTENIPELKTLIRKIVEMHDDVNTVIKEFPTPIALFNQTHKINSTELAGVETTPSKTLRKNGMTPPILTHPTPPNSPLVYVPEALAFPLVRTCADADTSATVGLASESNLEGVCLTATANALFGVYQDWVHQNPTTHLN